MIILIGCTLADCLIFIIDNLKGLVDRRVCALRLLLGYFICRGWLGKLWFLNFNYFDLILCMNNLLCIFGVGFVRSWWYFLFTVLLFFNIRLVLNWGNFLTDFRNLNNYDFFLFFWFFNTNFIGWYLSCWFFFFYFYYFNFRF